MTRRVGKQAFFSAGSVALADILANSVAVILILIVVTLSVQQEEAQQKIEQNADITTILARQLATTVVYNDLPSSPPARLHNYRSCAIPHDCNPSLYPIIELHQNFIREYNSNLKFYRDELLQTDNPFDNLIRTFNENERRSLRIDVYDVRLYYLAIGILKEHNINPRHWHYLGEKVTPPISHKQALKDGGHGEADAIMPKTAGISNKFNSTGGKNQLKPQGTEYADFESLSQLQKESLLPNDSDYQSPQSSEMGGGDSQGNSQQDKESQQLVNPDTLLESLVELLNNGGEIPSDKNNQGKGNNKPRQQRSMKMHVPNSSKQSKNAQSNASMNLSIAPEKYDEIIVAFLIDQLMLARQQHSAFVQNSMEILNRYLQKPSLLNNHPNEALIRNLTKQLKNKQKQPNLNYAPLLFRKVNQSNQLLLSINQIGATNTVLVNAQNSTWSKFIQQSPNRISLLLRSFPGLYGGQVLDIPKDALLILHPNEKKIADLQWRPVVITDPWLENPAMGFIRASIKNNQLLLDPQSHQTKIDKVLVAEPIKHATKQSIFNTQMIYIVSTATILLLLSIVLLNYRNRQKYPS